jgi:hypothetical protein
MAATDLSAVTRGSGWRTRQASLHATAGNVRQVILPTWARRVTLTCRDSGGTADDWAVADSGTDDAAQVATAFRVGAGAALELSLAPGGGSLYVSGPAGGTCDLLLARS